MFYWHCTSLILSTCTSWRWISWILNIEPSISRTLFLILFHDKRECLKAAFISYGKASVNISGILTKFISEISSETRLLPIPRPLFIQIKPIRTMPAGNTISPYNIYNVLLLLYLYHFLGQWITFWASVGTLDAIWPWIFSLREEHDLN